MERRLAEAKAEIEEVILLVLTSCLFVDSLPILQFLSSVIVFLALQEKRKTRKALEMKKVLEARLEASDQR